MKPLELLSASGATPKVSRAQWTRSYHHQWIKGVMVRTSTLANNRISITHQTSYIASSSGSLRYRFIKSLKKSLTINKNRKLTCKGSSYSVTKQQDNNLTSLIYKRTLRITISCLKNEHMLLENNYSSRIHIRIVN